MKFRVCLSDPVKVYHDVRGVNFDNCSEASVREGKLLLKQGACPPAEYAEVITAIPGTVFYRVAGKNCGLKHPTDFRTMSLEAQS